MCGSSDDDVEHRHLAHAIRALRLAAVVVGDNTHIATSTIAHVTYANLRFALKTNGRNILMVICRKHDSRYVMLL